MGTGNRKTSDFKMAGSEVITVNSFRFKIPNIGIIAVICLVIAVTGLPYRSIAVIYICKVIHTG
jgi:hypothetical protein